MSRLKKDNLKYWVALSRTEIIGPKRWQKLLDNFPDLTEAWQAPFSDLVSAGLMPKVAEEFIHRRKKIDPNLEWEKIESLGAALITIQDDDYPRLLKEIYSPPPLLYCLGRLNLNNDFTLAIVGTRKMTGYGRQVTELLAGELAATGLTIVSGLALGLDACAHQAAIDAGGKTVAVLGCGLDKIYPRTNRRLAEKILETDGAIISEFPLQTLPLKHHFPQRNRIISGLSLATLVPEAGLKSGALITAKYALEQNREIFAVPGNIFNPLSAGPNQLIKLGAKVATTAAEILEALNLQQPKFFKAVKEVIPETETEKIIWEILAHEPLHVDKLAQLAKLDISVVNSALTVMEMKGMVRNLGGQIYARSR